MKNLISNFLKKMGIYHFFAMLKAQHKQDIIQKLKMPNKYIEFIGPSGVGKSTLFNKVKNSMYIDWNYIEHISSVGLTQNDNELDGSLHWDLLVKKTNNIDKKNISGFQKINLMKYFSEIIFRDFCMANGHYDKGFLLEEGLCHNFSRELAELPLPKFINLMKGRIIIYLIPQNSYTVVKRLRKRELEGGHVVTHHIGLSDHELQSIVEESLSDFEKLINKAELIGIPICKLLAEHDLLTSVDAISVFEKQIVTFDGI